MAPGRAEGGARPEPMRDSVAARPPRRTLPAKTRTPAAKHRALPGSESAAPAASRRGAGGRRALAAGPEPPPQAAAAPAFKARSKSGGFVGYNAPVARAASSPRERPKAARPAVRRKDVGGARTSSPGVSRRTRKPVKHLTARRLLAHAAQPRRGATVARHPGARRSPRPKARPPSAAQKSAALKPPLLRPVLLSRLLGKNAIRPPLATVKVPDLSPLAARAPKNGPDGRPLQWFPAGLDAVEAARPPGQNLLACRLAGGHWHAQRAALYHERTAWGLRGNAGCLWLQKSAGCWWAWTAPAEPTWRWHGEHWWWQSGGVWFLLHQGQAWGYRLFSEHQAEGLIHPGTGTRMLYSADGRRAAVITPGDGAWLFDARTGAVLGRWTEAQMPARPKPHAPSGVTLPP